ncbi:unnamed protein product [Amoebophrya sp. A25]|nr:unnamed protein product [Amoebophrya sp. A25]|eukprot:GSA25T00016468001.1
MADHTDLWFSGWTSAIMPSATQRRGRTGVRLHNEDAVAWLNEAFFGGKDRSSSSSSQQRSTRRSSTLSSFLASMRTSSSTPSSFVPYSMKNATNFLFVAHVQPDLRSSGRCGQSGTREALPWADTKNLRAALDVKNLRITYACLPILFVESRTPPPWEQTRELSFFDDNCRYYHRFYINCNYALGALSILEFFLGELVVGFLSFVSTAMGLYAVTPEGLQSGGSTLSSTVVVSGVQGVFQSLTFLNFMFLRNAAVGAKASSGSLFLLPLLKASFALQPLASFAVMYSGYQLLKCVRSRLFSTAEPLLQAAASGGAEPRRPSSFRAFMGHGHQLAASSAEETIGNEEAIVRNGYDAAPDFDVNQPSTASVDDRTAPSVNSPSSTRAGTVFRDAVAVQELEEGALSPAQQHENQSVVATVEKQPLAVDVENAHVMVENNILDQPAPAVEAQTSTSEVILAPKISGGNYPTGTEETVEKQTPDAVDVQMKNSPSQHLTTFLNVFPASIPSSASKQSAIPISGSKELPGTATSSDFEVVPATTEVADESATSKVEEKEVSDRETFEVVPNDHSDMDGGGEVQMF